MPNAAELDRVGGRSIKVIPEGVEEAEFDRVRNQWDECQAALDNASVDVPNAHSVITEGVLNGRTVEHYIPTLRLGLNALARVLKIGG